MHLQQPQIPPLNTNKNQTGCFQPDRCLGAETAKSCSHKSSSASHMMAQIQNKKN